MKKLAVLFSALALIAGFAALGLSAVAPPVGDVQAAAVSVPNTPYTRTLRSVALEDLVVRDIAPLGIYEGSPKVIEQRQWYADHFYDTLASRKVWKDGTSPYTHKFGAPITWDIVPIPQYVPPPCDQPQPTGYDAEGCRYVNALFKDVEKADPAKAKQLREQARRGRDVWFKGTFGNQDEEYIHTARTVGYENIWYPWMDTRTRKERFTKWGMLNDPDCTEGDASTHWYDRCPDPHSSGVLGYRKYFADPVKDESGQVVFDPASSPYREDELKKNMRYLLGGACVQCHVAFDPTNPPTNPNEPKWENIDGLIGNKYTNQPQQYLQGLPADSFIHQVLRGGRVGTVDTSLQPNDFQHNPGTQNNIMDFMNRLVHEHTMKHPITGELKKGKTQNVLKGGEDSVGDHLALIRVYVNIGMCTEECWVPNFPVPGSFFGEKSHQRPFRISQCYKDCEAWNHADAKILDLAAFLVTGGPAYLMNAKDVDGTPGSRFVDVAKAPLGHKVFSRECAVCHSSFMPPDSIKSDKDALEEFYRGHVFGKEDYWQREFDPAQVESPEFKTRYLAQDATGKLRPKQFAEKDIYGQDWLGNDEPTPFNVIGTNMCRAMHDNHNEGHIWEEFSSEDYKKRASPGTVPRVLNRMVPGLGGRRFGEKKIEGGPGYLRNVSLLSIWSHAPFLHNNAIGEMTTLQDGTLDTSVAGSVKQFEMAFEELMMSDNQAINPHRAEKITVTDRDIKLAPREDGKGPIKLPVKTGTPIAYFTSSDTHRPLFQKCDDLVENKGHQFGIDLSPADKLALREFLKLM
ncbi:MAG: hypothetical protein ACRETN_10890 [Nevskiales bacterium]